MKIIIVGIGKVGLALAEQLVVENHDVVLIDNNTKKLQAESDNFDLQVLKGNGATAAVLTEAGVADCDIFIASTGNDELNILCCLMSRKLGGKHNIARVRNPDYAAQMAFMREELGFNMVINPEKIAADEISRILRAPGAMKIDVFARGRVEIMNFLVREGSILDGMLMENMERDLKANVLVCAIERDEEIIIPNGNVRIQKGDKVSFIVPTKIHGEFFRNAGFTATAVKSVIIVGGSRISIYLARQLLNVKIKVKIIEQNEAKCGDLAEKLPRAIIVNGDGTDHQLLMEEGLNRVDALIALTSVDEENIILSMFANQMTELKTIAKVNRQPLVKLAKSMDSTSSIISIKNVTTQTILKYVRSVQNSVGSNVENLYHIIDNKVEAMEFRVKNENSLCLNKSLSDLKIKPDILIACIIRDGEIIVPKGSDEIKLNDNVIVVSTKTGLLDLSDILA